MVKYNIGRYVTAIVVLSITSFFAIAFLRNNLTFKDVDSIMQDITATVTIVTIICTIFVSWAWKWRIFQRWLVPFPCLSGEWNGEIISTFHSDKRTIPVEVTIKHYFFNIQVQATTCESTSISICGSFDIDEHRGLKQLIYSYQNAPKATVRDRSEIHYGTVRFEISSDAKTLEGEYWTSRKTTGDIKLAKG